MIIKTFDFLVFFIILIILSSCNNVSSTNEFHFNGKIAWLGKVGNDYEVFCYDGDMTYQITDNDYDEKFPRISANGIAWTVLVDSMNQYYDLFYYDWDTTYRLIENSNQIQTGFFHLYGNSIVWIELDGNDFDIFLFNGIKTIQIADNIATKWEPQIHGDNIVWFANDGDDYEIFLYNGSTTIQITDNDIPDAFANVYGDSIVWYACFSTGSAICLYDGSTISPLTDSVYHKNMYSLFPLISESYVVWEAEGDSINTSAIYVLKGSVVHKIEEIPVCGCGLIPLWPKLSKNTVVWRNPCDSIPNDAIYLYNGSSVKILADLIGEPEVSGDYVVWADSDGNDLEIFLYDGYTIHQITDNDYNDRFPDVWSE